MFRVLTYSRNLCSVWSALSMTFFCFAGSGVSMAAVVADASTAVKSGALDGTV